MPRLIGNTDYRTKLAALPLTACLPKVRGIISTTGDEIPSSPPSIIIRSKVATVLKVPREDCSTKAPLIPPPPPSPHLRISILFAHLALLTLWSRLPPCEAPAARSNVLSTSTIDASCRFSNPLILAPSAEDVFVPLLISSACEKTTNGSHVEMSRRAQVIYTEAHTPKCAKARI